MPLLDTALCDVYSGYALLAYAPTPPKNGLQVHMG